MAAVLGNITAALLVLGLVFVCVREIVRSHRTGGCGGCSGGCAGCGRSCGGCAGCGAKKTE